MTQKLRRKGPGFLAFGCVVDCKEPISEGRDQKFLVPFSGAFIIPHCVGYLRHYQVQEVVKIVDQGNPLRGLDRSGEVAYTFDAGYCSRSTNARHISVARKSYEDQAKKRRVMIGVGEAILLTAVSLALTAISLKLQKLLDAFDHQLIEVNYWRVE